MSVFLPGATAVSSRFITEYLVREKEEKIRETLRLMGLSRFSYAISFFILEAIFGIYSAVVMWYWVKDKLSIFPDEATMDERNT